MNMGIAQHRSDQSQDSSYSNKNSLSKQQYVTELSKKSKCEVQAPSKIYVVGKRQQNARPIFNNLKPFIELTSVLGNNRKSRMQVPHSLPPIVKRNISLEAVQVISMKNDDLLHPTGSTS